MNQLFLDFETRSELDPYEVGLDNYARHASTQVLMLGWAFDDRKVQLWQPHLNKSMPQELHDGLMNSAVTKVAWNAAFERKIFEHVLYWVIPYEQWLDPKVWAHHLSIPVISLGETGTVFGLTEDEAKIKDGKRLIQKFSMPHFKKPKKGEEFEFVSQLPEFWDWTTDPEDWEKFGEYCKQDVVAERAILRLMKDMPLPEIEQRGWVLDQKINDRGIPINRDFITKGLALAIREKTELTKALKEKTGLENPNSTKQILAWAQNQGYPFGSVRKEFVTQAMERMTPLGQEVMKLRQKASKNSYKKLEAMGNFLGADDRLRHQFLFLGASRTGRWAGTGAQVQNLVRPAKEVAKQYDKAISLILTESYQELKDTFGSVITAVTSCIRAAIQAPAGQKLVVCDLSAIENRVLGWVSNCDAILEVFRKGLDPYVSFAVKMYNESYEVLIKDKDKRQIAKPAVLGAGYGLGPGVKKNVSDDGVISYEEILKEDKYGNIVKTGLLGYAENMGIKLTPEQAYLAWQVFRNAYPEVPKYWKMLERAAVQVLTAKKAIRVRVGCTIFDRKKRKNGQFIMRIQLPSGRFLHYINARVERREFEGKDGPYERDSIIYDGIGHGVGMIDEGWGPVYTYGGKLCLAGHTRVLTSRGIVPLKDIKTSDALWDGNKWVAHDGVIFKGRKDTVEWNGLQATPNHQILAGNEWFELAKMRGPIGLASRLTGLVSALRLLFSLRRANKEERDFAVTAESCLTFRHEEFGEGMSNHARLAGAEPGGGVALPEKDITSFPIQPIDNGCSISEPELFIDVAIPLPQLIKTMGDAGLRFIPCGETTPESGSDTSLRYRIGMSQIWTWIESTIMEITSQETYSSLLERKIQIIGALLSILIFKIGESPILNLSPNLLPDGAKTPFTIISEEVEHRNGALRDTGVQEVFDIINAGPDRRFTVITDDGPLVVHNCENIVQAISRDILLNGMLLADEGSGDIVAHVHDEILVLSEDDPFSFDLGQLQKCMSTTPTWAPGLPLAAEGYESRIYRKG